MIPDELLNDSDHFDNLEYRGRFNRQRRYNYLIAQSNSSLLRKRLHDLVCDAGPTRPNIQTTR